MNQVSLASVVVSALIGAGVILHAQSPQQAKERLPTLLGPDDSITVLALNCEELSKEWRIGATGDVSFPLIGRLRMAGLTLEQAEQLIATRLKRYLNDPQVTVYAAELRSSPVTVAGAVEKPGRYQVSSASTLFEVLVQAGGPKHTGSSVVVKRSLQRGGIAGPDVKLDKDGQYALAEFEMRAVMDGPDGPGPKADFKMQPYDVVTVSPAPGGRYVHITGEVNRPGSVELATQESVSLMKVIAVAGGFSRNASASKTVIMHVTPEGIQTSTATVDVKKIMAGKSRDLDLTAGDVVVVPSSKGKTITQLLAGTAVTAGLTAVIYSIRRF